MPSPELTRSTTGASADERYSARVAEVVAHLQDARVLPLATVDDPERVGDVCRALAAGGITCVEIAFRTAAAAVALEHARDVEGFLVGAGTVLTVEQAWAAAEAGADFAVAPCLNEDVVSACIDARLPFFPGVATLSELDRAHRLGLRIVEVFPAAELGGPAFLRAVSAPFRDVRFLPSGGIDATSLHEYLQVPAVVACGGGWLVQPELVHEGRFDEIERLAHEARKVAR